MFQVGMSCGITGFSHGSNLLIIELPPAYCYCLIAGTVLMLKGLAIVTVKSCRVLMNAINGHFSF